MSTEKRYSSGLFSKVGSLNTAVVELMKRVDSAPQPRLRRKNLMLFSVPREFIFLPQQLTTRYQFPQKIIMIIYDVIMCHKY